MGQYYHAYTKNATEERAWSLQCTNFTETRNFDWYVGLKLTEHSWYGNILTDAFGLVSLVAMMPLITIQTMGAIYVVKSRRVAQEPIKSFGDEEIIELWEVA